MSAGRRRDGLQGRYCFLCFFRPRDKRKNLDWSDLIDYLIHTSDWLATCHSKPLKGPSQPPPFSMTSKLLIWHGEANSYCFTVSYVPESMVNYFE